MSYISLLSIFSLSQDDPSEELLAKFKRNPVLENITEYLVEEASAEEEVLLGASADPISLDNGDKDNMTDITFEKDDELNRVSQCAQSGKHGIKKLIPGKLWCQEGNFAFLYIRIFLMRSNKLSLKSKNMIFVFWHFLLGYC